MSVKPLQTLKDGRNISRFLVIFLYVLLYFAVVIHLYRYVFLQTIMRQRVGRDHVLPGFTLWDLAKIVIAL